MPFAGGRVGIAQTNSSNDGGRRGSRGREKGITMEDLKKQTAIRLAQEQQQSQALPGPPKTAAVASDPRTKHPVVTPQTLAARRMAAAASVNNNRTDAAAPLHYQRLLHHNPMAHHHVVTPTDGVPPQVMTPPYHGASQGYHYDQTAAKNRNRNGRSPASKSSSSIPVVVTQPATQTRYHPNQQSGYHNTGRSSSSPTLPATSPSTPSGGYNTASSNQGGQSNSSSKLPHGLTVHELKEMTKARLQAEAAEKMSAPADIETRDTSVQPTPYGQQQQQQSQSMQFDRMGQGSDVHLVSTQAPTKSLSYDQGSQVRQPAQVSPLPAAFQNYSAPSSSFDCNSSNDQRTIPVGNRNRLDSFPDNWESASVTSHNSTVASDYLGSESAFPSAVGGGFSQMEEPPGMALGRTQSYPIGNSRPFGNEMLSRETSMTPTSMSSPHGSSSSSYFDPSMQSRQRAMTLSPRPGLSLLHEDRPGFSDEDLGIPNFSSSRHGRQPLTARSRRSFSPVLQQQTFVEQPSLVGGFGSHAPGVIGGSILDNRPRTSSTVSLPAISHTAEEFALDSTLRRSSDSVNVNNRGGAPIRENPPIGSAESFLSSSSLYGSSDSAGQSSASVFRNDFGGIPAPPGLGGPSRGDGATGGIDSNRGRAATWVAGQMSGADSMFGSGGLYDYSGEDTLAGDLASILKMSGAEEKPADTGRLGSGMFSGGFL